MSIISRYLLKEFGRLLLFSLIGCVLVFLVVDFLEKIDNFMDAGIPMSRVAWYFLMTIPSVVFNMAPVAVLVAILISLGVLARHSEIVAFKAAGVGLFRLSLPIVLASMLISLLMFVLADTVIPKTSARVNSIWTAEVEKKKDANSPISENVWFRHEGGIYYFKLFDHQKHKLEGVHVYKLNHQFRLNQRIEARTALRTDGQWLFREGLIKKYLPDGNFTVQHFDRQTMDLPEFSESFVQTERSADEMGLLDLTKWIRQMKAEGYDPLRYRVELHLKLAFPFICTIMTVIGLPIAFWKEKGGGIALGIGAGIGLSFVYLVVLGLSRSLGYSGLLPPAAAAWLPNVLFVLLGLYLFTYVRQ